VLHGQFAPEYLVRPPGTPWSIIGGTHFHIAAERLINFSGIPTLTPVDLLYRLYWLRVRKCTQGILGILFGLL
jgi:hypothetical protein